MTEKEKDIVARYLVDWGKELIKDASIRTVDLYAKMFCSKLQGLGKEKEAQEVYDYYVEVWG